MYGSRLRSYEIKRRCRGRAQQAPRTAEGGGSALVGVGSALRFLGRCHHWLKSLEEQPRSGKFLESHPSRPLLVHLV